jgi:hypothetical protein
MEETTKTRAKSVMYVVLYGCETWSLALREEHRLRVFENRVLREIFGPKRDEAIGGWRKLHNEELHNLYFSPSIIRMIKSRRMRWSGHVARMGEKRIAYRILVRNYKEIDHWVGWLMVDWSVGQLFGDFDFDLGCRKGQTEINIRS